MNEQAQREYVQKVREGYLERRENDFDRLKKLDAKVRRPAEIFTYTFGVLSALVLGVGMCLTMGVLGGGGSALMAAGIVIGVLGIGMASANYFLYRAMLQRRKKKYAKEILRLSDACLNG